MSFVQHLAETLPSEKQWIIHQRIAMQTRAQLYEQLLEFEQSFLKPVLKKYGAESPQYKFLNAVKDTIIQAAEQQYVIENQRERIVVLEQLNEYLNKENCQLATALNRYETIEEMSVAGTLQTYIDIVQKQIKERQLNDKKSAATNHG